MDKEQLNALKENEEVKFIYRLPCSLFDNGFEYVIIGNTDFTDDTARIYTLEEWFNKMDSGSLLPYVCSTLSKSNKIKEYLNIYKKPDLLKLRKFILSLPPNNERIQESVWGCQLIEEQKVNRVDVFRQIWDADYVMFKYMRLVDPMYKEHARKTLDND